MRKDLFVLITGGAGYIGSHAMLEAPSQGFHPVAFDNLSEGHRWAVKGSDLVVGDLSDEKAVRRVFARYKPKAVMHFASHLRGRARDGSRRSIIGRQPTP